MVVCEYYSADSVVVSGKRHQSGVRLLHREGFWCGVKRQIGVVLTLGLVALCGPSLRGSDDMIPLTEASFFLGDDKAFSDPGFDDSTWEKIIIGESWQEAALGGVGDIGWYRFRVTIPEKWMGEALSFSPGYIGNVAEIYWDGRLIGAKGSLEPLTGLEWLGRYEVFAIDPEAISPREHVIAVRVGCVFSEGGLVGALPAVGVSGELQRIQLETERRPAFWLVGQMFLYAVFGLLGIVLLCAAPRNLSHWYFMGMFWGEFLMQGYRGASLLADLPFSLLLWQLVTIGYWGCYSGFLLLLIEDFFRGETSRWARRLVFGLVLASAATAFSVGSMFYFPVGALLGGVSMVCMSWIGWLLISEVRNKDGRAILLLAVWAVLLASYVPEVLNYITPVVSEVDKWTPLSSWFGLVMIAVYGILLAAQLTSYRTRARRLAGHVFSAKEEERARIARELHDGVARSVFHAREKLTLEIDETSDGVRSLSRVIDEIREVAYDLHPTQLNGYTLEEACRAYLQELDSEEFQGQLRFSIPGVDSMTDRELYRIFQEFTSNAMRHGSASELTVALEKDANRGWFCLEENGRGFDVRESSAGLGLRSIQERAELLGGTAQWERGRLRGSKLTVTWTMDAMS